MRRAMLFCLFIPLVGCDLFKDEGRPWVVTGRAVAKEEGEGGEGWENFPENIRGQENGNLKAIFLGEVLEGGSRIIARVYPGDRVYIKLEAWETMPHFYEEMQTLDMAVVEDGGGYTPCRVARSSTDATRN